MPRINLLPWREGQRKERKLGLLVALGVAGLAGLATAFAAYLLYGSWIEAQQHRNDQLRGERSEEHTSELQSRTLISYAVFCLR